MILKAIIDDQIFSLNVPEQILEQGQGYFAKLDQDMDQGWQMSREWVDNPDRLQRCQIAADKLLTCLEEENHKVGMLIAGYLVHKLPNIHSVDIDIRGEIQNTEFTFKDGHASALQAEGSQTSSGGVHNKEAMEQAEREVTQVFKVGKTYRFSVFDHRSGAWHDSPASADQEGAERLRQDAVRQRLRELQAAPTR